MVLGVEDEVGVTMLVVDDVEERVTASRRDEEVREIEGGGEEGASSTTSTTGGESVVFKGVDGAVENPVVGTFTMLAMAAGSSDEDKDDEAFS